MPPLEIELLAAAVTLPAMAGSGAGLFRAFRAGAGRWPWLCFSQACLMLAASAFLSLLDPSAAPLFLVVVTGFLAAFAWSLRYEAEAGP